MFRREFFGTVAAVFASLFGRASPPPIARHYYNWGQGWTTDPRFTVPGADGPLVPVEEVVGIPGLGHANLPYGTINQAVLLNGKDVTKRFYITEVSTGENGFIRHQLRGLDGQPLIDLDRGEVKVVTRYGRVEYFWLEDHNDVARLTKQLLERTGVAPRPVEVDTPLPPLRVEALET